MLAVFMLLSPRDAPRYYSESSRMATRSNPLTPGLLSEMLRVDFLSFFFVSGLGFRPQPDVEKSLIYVTKTGVTSEPNPYAQSLDQYLSVCKSKEFVFFIETSMFFLFSVYPERALQAKKVKAENDDDDDDDDDDDKKQQAQDDRPQMQPFRIRNAGDCTSENKYGYETGKPCVLVKMNKVN